MFSTRVCSHARMGARPGAWSSLSHNIPQWPTGLARLLFLSLAACFFGTQPGIAQSNSRIERLTPVDAPRLLNGLGWNVLLTNEWEFAKVKAGGGIEARMQFGWEAVEAMDGTLSLTHQMQTALAWCRKYGLQPLIVAAYGGPRQKLMDLRVRSNTPPGSYVIPVTPVGGQLTSIVTPYSHVIKSDGSWLVAGGKGAYYGALIDSVNPPAGTIRLASATSVALPAGSTLTVNRLLYASPASTSAADPSVAAYARYVRFLANQIAANGLTGKVEIWNEPPWANDPWDHRAGFYDLVPPGISTAYPNWGLLLALLNDSPPGGVRYTWGGSHKTGFAGALEAPAPGITQAQAANAVPSDGWHPYGNGPEDHAWYPDQLLTAGNVFTTQLEGTDRTSNFKYDRKVAANHLIDFGWTVSQQVTETGLNSSDEVLKARFNIRTFLVYMSLGPPPQLDRLDFYRLADVPGGFGFVDSATQTELQSYTATKGLMADIASVGVAPLPYTTADLPSAAPSYNGYFPLSTIPIVGRSSASSTSNNFLFILYQRTYGPSWTSVPSPPPVPATINLPSGTTALSAVDLVTRLPVALTRSGASVTLNVSDDPIEVTIGPSGM